MKKQLTLISALSLLVLAGVSKDLLIHLKSGEELTFTTDKVDQVRFSGSIGDAEMPEDPYPSATDFSHKVLLMDHTGTDCGNCPIVTSAFRQLEADDAYSSSYTLAALHSYAGDPMGNAMIRAVSGAYMNGTGWPYVSVNLTKTGDGAYANIEKTTDAIRALIDGQQNMTVSGVAANAKLDGNTLNLSLSVKAGENGNYGVGAFVIEDGIVAEQTNLHPDVTGDADFNTHNNVVRAIVGRQTDGTCPGIELGSIVKGETATTSQSITLSDSWKLENCRLILYVTEEVDGKYVCVNSAYAPISGETPFAYDSEAPATDSYVTLEKNMVESDFNAADLSVTYELKDGADASKLQASSSAYWIKDVKVADGKVTFSITENVSDAARTGRISLCYDGARAIDITVNQACEPKENEDLFTFNVTVISPYSVSVDITTHDFDGNYLYLVAKASAIDKYIEAGNIQGWIDGDLQWLQEEADYYGLSLEEFLLRHPSVYMLDGISFKGVEYKKLDPNTDYYIYAYGLETDGTVTTEFYKQRFTTEVVNQVDLTFTATVDNISGTSANISITPSDNTNSYFWTYVSEMDYSLYSEEFIMDNMIANIRDYVDKGVDPFDIIHVGPSGEAPNGLWEGTKYYIIAWGMDDNLTPTTKPQVVTTFTTLEYQYPFDCEFDIELLNVTSQDIQVKVTPTDNDIRYYVAFVDEEKCKGYNKDQMAQRIINMENARFEQNFYGADKNWGNVDWVLSGEQTIWGRKDLGWTFSPQHTYNIYAFGVDNSGERTTVVNMVTATTPKAAQSDMTFEVTLDEEQSYWHYGYFNIKPSNDNEYYITLLVQTEELKYVMNEDGTFDEARLCEEIDEFYDHSPNYATRTGEFTMMNIWVPDTDYTLLVCGWAGGNTTPFYRFDCHSPAIPFNESDADVNISYELFDGTELEAFDPVRWKGYSGNVLIWLTFEPNDLATYWCGGVWMPSSAYNDIGGEAYLVVLDMNETVSYVNKKNGQYRLTYGGPLSLSGFAMDKDGKMGRWHYEEFEVTADKIIPVYDFWSHKESPEKVMTVKKDANEGSKMLRLSNKAGDKASAIELSTPAAAQNAIIAPAVQQQNVRTYPGYSRKTKSISGNKTVSKLFAPVSAPAIGLGKNNK